MNIRIAHSRTSYRKLTMQLKCLSALLATSIACAAALAAPNLRAADDKPMQVLSPEQAKVEAEALNAFRQRRYSAAFGRFAELADAGHVPSAEIALMMSRHGATLFGSEWDTSVPRQARWNALVINSARGRTMNTGGFKGE